jgi:copper chaperone CopZ
MNAVHIQTEGMHCAACPPLIEAEVEHLPGVKAARAYRSMHLTSVLFDPELVDADAIRDRITRAGFDAHVLGGDRAH